MKKAYFVHNRDDWRGYVIHAETPGKAKQNVRKQMNIFDFDYIEFTEVRAKRQKDLDNKPITIQSMIDVGFDMTFEGEPIVELDVKCDCDICKINGE
jgi:hypothetical protein